MSEINIKSTTIEKSIEAAKDFLQKLVGPSVDEMGLLFADKIKLWRLKNQIRNLDKVKKIVDKRGLELRQVNLKVLVPYLEGVSLEEEEFLHEKWANLFVNYIDSEKNLSITVYPNVLKQLSTNEVKILDYLKNNRDLCTDKYRNRNSEIDFEFAEISNLERLGLIKERIEVSQPDLSFSNQLDVNRSEIYYLTDFGHEFVEACRN